MGYLITLPWGWVKIVYWREGDIALAKSVHSTLRHNDIIFSPWCWVKSFIGGRGNPSPTIHQCQFLAVAFILNLILGVADS